VRAIVFVLPLLLLACSTPDAIRTLDDVQSWAIQLQGLEQQASIDRMAGAGYGMVVVDPVSNVRGLEAFDTAAMVKRLRAGAICLAYFNVGQAEDYRTYWRKEWRAPTRERPGAPAFLLTVDPEGWKGDYPVAFWEKDWKAILARRIDDVVRQGFDGIYCDWVLAFDDPTVRQAATAAGIDGPRAMADLLQELRKHARKRNPRFLLVMQNGEALFGAVPGMASRVDGYAQEPVSFGGAAGAGWEDAAAGDKALPATGAWSTQSMLASLRRIRAQGVPTFTIDYAIDPAHARIARERARAVGAVPFVTRVSLDRLPTR